MPINGNSKNNSNDNNAIPRQRLQQHNNDKEEGECKTPTKPRKTTKHNRVPLTPPILSQHTEDVDDSLSPKPSRARINSREYIQSYDGAFGSGNDDMKGFEMASSGGGWWEDQQWFLFSAYVLVLVLVGVVVMMVVSLVEDNNKISKLGGTVTNIIHFLVTLSYFHWSRGGYSEHQGELDDMTLWEQIDGTPGTTGLRFALRLVPTVLCYLACIEAGWDDAPAVCTVNVIVWSFMQLGKMPFMNGRRIFGINRHPSIAQGE